AAIRTRNASTSLRAAARQACGVSGCGGASWAAANGAAANVKIAARAAQLVDLVMDTLLPSPVRMPRRRPLDASALDADEQAVADIGEGGVDARVGPGLVGQRPQRARVRGGVS